MGWYLLFLILYAVVYYVKSTLEFPACNRGMLFWHYLQMPFICSGNGSEAIVIQPARFGNMQITNVQPLVIAAHPQESSQFAVGFSDGGVYVFEPRESEGKWGVPSPIENGSTSDMAATSVGASSDEAQR